MFSPAPIRPLIARWRDWLPLAVLALVALASLFALGGDRGYLYRWGSGNHNLDTAKNVAIAGNISPKHNFLLTTKIWVDEYGGYEYDSYGRFPFGGYVLIRLVMLPFGNDITAQLLAARALALVMFCGAALFAYLAVVRIAGSRWIALAAVFLAFSSLYALYYADAVASETVMDTLSAMMVFHGMIIFVQEGRFRQLLVKTCVALLMGWHVYALIMPFALLSFGGEALALVRAALASGGGVRAALAALPALARSRFVALAAVAVLLGASLLALNFASEYMSYDGNRSWRKLPSVDSMLSRLGFTDAYISRPDAAWGSFSRRQIHRAGVASAPYAAAGLVGREVSAVEPESPSPAWGAWGVAATAAALAALALVPRQCRLPMASVILMGFCWALPTRGTTSEFSHAFEGMFYVGLPLALWSGALIGARRLLGARLGGALAVAAAALAAPLFALSVAYAAQVARDDRRVESAKTEPADYSAIMELARGKRVLTTLPTGYRLTGSYMLESDACRDLPLGAMDFVVSPHRDESLDLLTPDNWSVFLYGPTDPLELCISERRWVESSEPLARSTFDVYFQAGPPAALRYLKPDCAPEDLEAPFFIHVYGENPDSAGGGFAGVSPVRFSRRAEFDDGACLLTFYNPPLLHRPASHIRTGQYVSGGGRLWEAVISPPPSAARLAAYEREYQATASREPAARSGFDLYLDADGGELSYLRQPCSEEDARGRFFLSVHPARAADLPAARRALGHESRNFDFEPPHGVVFNGKCMATVQLPDYEIAKIETGQDAPGAGRLWAATVKVGD